MKFWKIFNEVGKICTYVALALYMFEAIVQHNHLSLVVVLSAYLITYKIDELIQAVNSKNSLG